MVSGEGGLVTTNDETLARIRRDASPWPELTPAAGDATRNERRILECGEPRAMLIAPLELPHGHGALGLERPASPDASVLLAASAGVLAAAAMAGVSFLLRTKDQN